MVEEQRQTTPTTLLSGWLVGSVFLASLLFLFLLFSPPNPQQHACKQDRLTNQSVCFGVMTVTDTIKCVRFCEPPAAKNSNWPATIKQRKTHSSFPLCVPFFSPLCLPFVFLLLPSPSPLHLPSSRSSSPPLSPFRPRFSTKAASMMRMDLPRFVEDLGSDEISSPSERLEALAARKQHLETMIVEAEANGQGLSVSSPCEKRRTIPPSDHKHTQTT